MKRVRSSTREKLEQMRSVIEEFIEAHGYSPTFREIAELAEIRSTESVRKYLRHLSASGVLTYQQGCARSITLRRST